MKELNLEIGQRIAQLRREHAMTQDKFAELLDTSPKHCSEVERGHSCFSLEKLLIICDTFHITMDYLVRGTEESSESLLNLVKANNEDEKRILKEYLLLFNEIKKLDRSGPDE